MRRSALLPIVLLLAGCDGAPEPAASARPVAAVCVSRPEGSRWAGDYHGTAVFGDTDDEAMSGWMLAGIAVTDSVVYVLETDRSVLWLLRPDLSVIGQVGQEGDGPGEWRMFGASPYGGSMRRVSASKDGVRLFDGRRVQQLDPRGRFRRMVVNGSSETLPSMQSRLVFLGDTTFYSAGGHDPLSSAASGRARAPRTNTGAVSDERQPWAVRMRADGDDRLVLQLGLVPVRGRGGVGPAQAVPKWDSNGKCAVASDGAEPLLVYAPIGGRQDTVRVPLPERMDRNENYAGKLDGISPPGVGLDEPSAAARLIDLVLDPDGIVWLLPIQPDEPVPGGVEVIRVPLGGGVAVTDTVPAFPRAFGPPGVYYARVDGPDDEMLVARYERVSTNAEGRAGMNAPPEAGP